MFTMRRTGHDLTVTFGALPEKVRAEVAWELRMLTDLLREMVIGKLSGEVLRAITGRLRGQVRSSLDVSGEVMVGRVYMDGDTTVAMVHEYGGQGPYVIVPIKAQALAFVAGGRGTLSGGPKTLAPGLVFAKRVNHPPLPERSYLRSSLVQMKPTVETGFKTALARALGATQTV